MFNEYKLNFNYILLSINDYNETELLEINSLLSIVFNMDMVKDKNQFLHKLQNCKKIFSKINNDAQVQFVDWLKEIIKVKFGMQA